MTRFCNYCGKIMRLKRVKPIKDIVPLKVREDSGARKYSWVCSGGHVKNTGQGSCEELIDETILKLQEDE